MSNTRLSTLNFEVVVQTSPHPYLFLDSNCIIVGANPAYLRLVRRTHEELAGHHLLEAFPEQAANGNAAGAHGVRASLERVLRQRRPDRVERVRYAIVRGSGADARFAQRCWCAVHTPVLDEHGAVAFIIQSIVDVTETERAREELYITNERLKFALEGSGDGVWDWDLSANRIVYSRRWKEILGHAVHEIGSSPVEWQHRLHPQDRAATLAALEACLQGNSTSFSSEHRLRCRNGEWKWVLMRAMVVARDAEQRALRMTGTMSDISGKRIAEERVWQHANFDMLTNLPNRRLFRDRLEQEVKKAHRSGLNIGLLFIDLDRFKEVNDLFGHDAGDQLLTQAAQRLAACVRDSDTVARLGGDEFTVILSELDSLENVEKVASKILHSLRQPFQLDNEVAYLSGSVGITVFPSDAREPEELIRNADQAMYGAKNAGRNQFSYFTHSMQEKAHTRLRLSGDLRKALAAGELKVYYQPVVELATGRITKAEALLRWYHPVIGAVDPAQFVPLAEESGIIHEIGDWVFREAASCSRRWGEQLGLPFQIGVNKSPVQFLAPAEHISWAAHLKNMGLSGNSISVEITEGLLLNASSTVSDKLLEYRDAGIQVAIDDFGTGYSSMAYLKKFDIDYLKIDQSFVRDMASDESDRAIAESMIVMAHRLGLKVIAEGIETDEQRQLLTAAGCDFGQGYLYAKATPPDEFERLLTHNARAGGALLH